MSDPGLERLTGDYLDGTLDEEGQRRLEDLLERDPAARAEFADQVQLHHRLGPALRPETPEGARTFAGAVVRRLGFEKDGRRFAAEVVWRLRSSRFDRSMRYVPLAAAAALVVALAGLLWMEPDPTPAPVPAASRGRVLLVVGRLPLADGDDLVQKRLETLGFAVAPVAALTVRSGDAAGCAFVAVSSTARAEQISAAGVSGMGSLFRNLPVPLLVWEPRLFSDLGLASGTTHSVDWAASPHAGRLRVVDPAHPLAAGLTGPIIEVLSGRERVSWGRVGRGVRTVAVFDDQPERAALFAVEPGDVLEGGPPAPARRVGAFLFESAVPRLTAEGWRLFDAAAAWCAGSK
ncbi:MAG TPA: hypothetical protein VEJ18_14040 [Planctomycetota bacterium]|nr:hypothetical protein [Planctomycetota bacterium]